MAKNYGMRKIDANTWECNGLCICRDFYGDGEFSVQFCGDDIIFDTFEEATKFCRESDGDACEEDFPVVIDWRGYAEEPEDRPDPEYYPA